jgi:hypothetical protein
LKAWTALTKARVHPVAGKNFRHNEKELSRHQITYPRASQGTPDVGPSEVKLQREAGKAILVKQRMVLLVRARPKQDDHTTGELPQ